jgi:hypothetical protein
MINNFDIIREHLTFEKATKFDAETKKVKTINDTYDRYIIHIIKRAKDSNGKDFGSNESNRLIKTYEISSLEYFDAKKSHIIDLCESNGARAYILPQVRSVPDCLKEMMKIIIDNLENPTIKMQHLFRSATCAMHKSRAKRWILDLDKDNMIEYKTIRPDMVLQKKWTPAQVLALVRGLIEKCGHNPEDAYIVKTPNGNTLITPPFDLMTANKLCSMIYNGQKSFVTGIKWTGPGEYDQISSKKNGWLIKDGMALLYYSGEKNT